MTFTDLFAYGRLVRLSHTIFALPFAVMGAVLAAGGIPDLLALFWIVVAMVGARSAAMAMNRLADQDLDAANPRTAGRELPRGILSRRQVWLFLVIAVAVFVAACACLNRLVLFLSPVVLVVVLSYPYAKRFTNLCHLWLGAGLGLSPVGGWVAVRGGFGADFQAVAALGGAVVLWTAGFDVIYALLDTDFDRRKRLFSLPATLGAGPALWLSAIFHLFSVGMLVLAGALAGLGALWYVGVGLASLLLVAEHALVRPSDLSRVNVAFFTLNGIMSLVLMGFLVAEVLI